MDERYALRLEELRAMDRAMAVTLEATRLLCGDVTLRAEIEEARDDHERHVRDIDEFLTREGVHETEAGERLLSPSVRGTMQRARQAAPGQAASRLATAEHVVEDRYQQLLDGGEVPASAEGFMRQHYEDERRHAHELDEAAGKCMLPMR